MNTDESLAINKESWNKLAAKFYGKAALPRYGALAQSENELKLLGDVRGARVLEIGCGSGHSLLYLAQQGAFELWGLDLSPAQIEFAFSLLKENGVTPHLFESPMEENPGIPIDYFDLVVSVYAIGWTLDLPKTLGHICSYLKPGGCLVFSWEHPFYHCIGYENGRYFLQYPYHDETPRFQDSWIGASFVQLARKLATYINTLVDAGFVVERVIETTLDLTFTKSHNYSPEYWYSVPKAELIPTTMIIKARRQKQ